VAYNNKKVGAVAEKEEVVPQLRINKLEKKILNG